MMQVFVDSGFAVSHRIQGGVYHVELSLETTADYSTPAAVRSQLPATASMRPFFEPRVVAVIGANRQRGKIGSEILHNLIASGFTGTIAAIHPTPSEIDGG